MFHVTPWMVLLVRLCAYHHDPPSNSKLDVSWLVEVEQLYRSISHSLWYISDLPVVLSVYCWSGIDFQLKCCHRRCRRQERIVNERIDCSKHSRCVLLFVSSSESFQRTQKALAVAVIASCRLILCTKQFQPTALAFLWKILEISHTRFPLQFQWNDSQTWNSLSLFWCCWPELLHFHQPVTRNSYILLVHWLLRYSLWVASDWDRPTIVRRIKSG